MINQQINIKFSKLAVLLLLDSPQKMEFGIDNTSWKVGEKFKGVKLIPLGIHFIHFALPDQKYLFRISKFIYFSEKKKIIVLRWNKNSQDFLPVSQSQQSSYIHGVKQFYFDCYLGPYPEQRKEIWIQSSNFITEKILHKLDPIQTISNIQSQYGTQNKTTKMNEQVTYQEFSAQQQQEQVKQNNQNQNEACQQNKQDKNVSKFQVMRGTVYYSEIPKKISYDLQHTTSVNLDKTQILQLMFKREYKGQKQMMLGQLQYSFISFLLGENLQSFQQWKKLINLICFSENATNVYLEFYLAFIVVLFTQIKQFPKDFFIDELSKDSFLVKCLRRLYEYEISIETNKKLRKRIEKLRQLIEKNFEYYIQIEQEQDQPTILEQDSQYY